MPHRIRNNIRPGNPVAIILKKDQRTGKQTTGVVKDLLTNSQTTRTASSFASPTDKSAACRKSSNNLCFRDHFA